MGALGKLRTLAGAARGPGADPRHLQGRRRHRRGQDRALGDRGLPAQPRALRATRWAHAPRRAALRSARHRQDAARARGRRRGARRLLLDLRLGVHRGDRRRGRLARARPVREGQGGRARDHLHRRARRDRALAPGFGVSDGRQRRARADARSDPHRTRRLRELRGGGGARRDQPPRRARLGAAAPRTLRSARHRAGPRSHGKARNPRSAHALDPARAERRPRRARRHHPGHGGRRPREPRQRGRAAGRAARARGGGDGGPHRFAGEADAGLAARHPPLSRRPRAHRLSRVRARARGDAHGGRRSRAQGLDHPAWDGARRDALHARLRSRLLLTGGAPGQDPRGARGSRGRGDRLRRRDDRRGIRHPAAHPDRAPDGRAVGA